MLWTAATLSDFTDDEYRTAYAALSPSRRARINRITHPHRRQQALAGECLAKRLIAQFASVEQPVIHTTEAGKPFVEIDGVHFSIAHSGDIVVCAVDSRPIGIDIERVKTVDNKLIKRVCTPEEIAFVGEDATAFCEVWTAKEAFVKMIGKSVPRFNEISVLPLHRQVFHHGEYIVQIVTTE